MKILDNGQVEIKNKRTGETRIVAPADLPSYGIKYTDYVTQAEARQRIPTEGGGSSTINNMLLPREQGPTATQKKVAGLTSTINVLEKNLGQVQLRGAIAGKFGKGIAALTGGGLATQTADYEALRKGLIGPVARAISEEVGVLTDRDIKRAEGLLPKVTDSRKLAQNKINNLRELIDLKSKAGAFSGNNMVRMYDPSGKLYEIDSSEAEEALKNGWRY